MRPNEGTKSSKQGRGITELAFPDHQHTKSKLNERFDRRCIANLVGSKLVDPKLPIPFGNRGTRTILMRVPEAAVNENRPPSRAIRDIGRAGQVTILDAKASPELGV
jgi:hypothetical protein